MRTGYPIETVQDHIMANTWRLIFEGNPYQDPIAISPPPTDFSRLEEILPEYRLIGLHLAQRRRRPYE